MICSRWPARLRPLGLIIGIVLIGLVGLMGLFAPWLAPTGPFVQDLLDTLGAPSTAHPLGTDGLGRDIASRIMYGANYELKIVLPAVVAALLIALPFGLLAGYRGRWVDRVISIISDSVLTFPSLVIAIVLVGVLGSGFWPLVLTLTVTQAPQMVRYIRGFTLQVSSTQYILASRAAGSTTVAIFRLHVLRNIIGPVAVITSLLASEALLLIAALGFLGIGVQPPNPEWGTMLSDGRTDFTQHPGVMIFPGLAIALLIMGFNLVGDGLRDRLDTSKG